MQILQLHLELDPVEGGERPTNDIGWKCLFPDGMEAKKGPEQIKEIKGYKSAKIRRPTDNPMWEAGHDDKEIFSSVRALLPVLDQDRAKLSTERRHANPCYRALACTSTPVVRPSNNKNRDWTPVASWAFLEMIYVARYHQKLFTSVAGHIRFHIQNGLGPYVASDSQTRFGSSGALTVDLTYPWPDCLVITEKSLEPAALAVNIADMERSKRSQLMSEACRVEIQRLIQIWEDSAVARSDLGPDGSIDWDISQALDKLILVSLDLLLPLHPGTHQQFPGH